VGAPSGDADAQAEVDGKGTSATFDQLLRRAAAARVRHPNGSEPDQTGAVADTGEGEAGTASEPHDQPG
jgi:hypothetical protein